MLYLYDERRRLWPAVARVLGAMVDVHMVLWLYPGQSTDDFDTPFAPATDPEWLEQVTTYDDGTRPPHSARVVVDEHLLGWLEEHIDDLEDLGDSLALYRPNERDWIAACVAHEGLIFADDQFGSALDAADYRFSDEPPE